MSGAETTAIERYHQSLRAYIRDCWSDQTCLRSVMCYEVCSWSAMSRFFVCFDPVLMFNTPKCARFLQALQAKLLLSRAKDLQ